MEPEEFCFISDLYNDLFGDRKGEPGFIFICDIYDGGEYYPLGVFMSLGDALETLAAGPDKSWKNELEPSCTVEIWKRKIGLNGRGKRVLSIHWKQSYDEKQGGYVWFSCQAQVETEEKGQNYEC